MAELATEVVPHGRKAAIPPQGELLLVPCGARRHRRGDVMFHPLSDDIPRVDHEAVKTAGLGWSAGGRPLPRPSGDGGLLPVMEQVVHAAKPAAPAGELVRIRQCSRLRQSNRRAARGNRVAAADVPRGGNPASGWCPRGNARGAVVIAHGWQRTHAMSQLSAFPRRYTEAETAGIIGTSVSGTLRRKEKDYSIRAYRPSRRKIYYLEPEILAFMERQTTCRTDTPLAATSSGLTSCDGIQGPPTGTSHGSTAPPARRHGAQALRLPTLRQRRRMPKLVATYGDLSNARPEDDVAAGVRPLPRAPRQGAAERPRPGAPPPYLEGVLRFRRYPGRCASCPAARICRAHLKSRGHKPDTIKRILASGAASLGWSYRRGELLAPPHVVTVPDNPTSACSRPRRSWRREAAQGPGAARAAPSYLMILLNTGCRPEAARPDGVPVRPRPRPPRSQPTRPRADQQGTAGGPDYCSAAAMADRPGPRAHHGGQQKHGRRPMEKGPQRAKLLRRGAYTIRHTIATELDERNAADERDRRLHGLAVRQTGWARGWYTKRSEYRPDYCKTVIAALDAWMVELEQHGDGSGCQRVALIPLTGPRLQPTCKTKSQRAGKPLETLERAKGFEPSTPTLARLCSTPELRPRHRQRDVDELLVELAGLGKPARPRPRPGRHGRRGLVSRRRSAI